MTARNRTSLLVKWLYTVRFDAPATSAMRSMLALSYPAVTNAWAAASMISSRFLLVSLFRSAIESL